MVRRVSMIFCVFAFLLSGCVPGFEEDDTKKIVEKDIKGNKEKEVEITPKFETTEQQYRTVVNFEPGAARGHILYGVENRLDIDELETGLMRLSKPTFPPDEYIYQDGQYLSSGTIESWLERKNMQKNKDGKPINPYGLNPPLPKNYDKLSWKKKEKYLKSHPSYLSYVVEQNYLVQTGEDKLQLGGVSLAISMNKVYSYEITDKKGLLHKGRVMLDPKKAKTIAKQVAEIVLQRVREKKGLTKVPIVIALYQEQTAESLVPGHFFARTVVGAGENTIEEWKKVNERHFLFPSDEAEQAHRGHYDKFRQFKAKIKEYFPNYIDVIGKGFYKNNELQRLKIRIPIRFYAQTEVISFTQYVAGLVTKKNPFSEEIPLEVRISSVEGPESVIVMRPGMEEPFVYIY